MPSNGTAEHAVPTHVIRAVKSIPKWGYVLIGVLLALGFGIVTPNERLKGQDNRLGQLGIRLDSALKILGAVAAEQSRQGAVLDWTVDVACDGLPLQSQRTSNICRRRR